MTRTATLLTAVIAICSIKPLSAAKVEDVSILPWDRVEDNESSSGWVVKYFHPDCGGCRLIEEPFESAVEEESVVHCRIAKINCKKHAEYCKQKEALEYPYIVYYNKKGIIEGPPLDVPDISDQIRLKALVSDFLQKKCHAISLPHTNTKPTLKKKPEPVKIEPDPQLKVWNEDLRRALYEALTGYAVKKGHEKAREYLVDLAKLAFPDKEVRSQLSMENVKFLVKSEDGRYDKWYGCQGSNLRYRGLPCGLWQLFHTLSLGCLSVECKGNTDPLLVMREWVIGYYNCKVCRQHFENETVSWLSRERSPSEVVLEIWTAHNEVSHRITGDPTDDPQHPKAFFPSPSLCPSCYPSMFSSRISSKAVVEFLLEYYPTPLRSPDAVIDFSFEEDDWSFNLFNSTIFGLFCLVLFHLWRRKRYLFIRLGRRISPEGVLPI
eukprot:TRINITY_DN24516_c0_g1_i1.p1 TRINITY_DN24516_c0_g1~~TRINITY_DN24516_c0_g1_i1.p1  ORF type:complete len:436 (+),score=32.38 TRINITY_DN24516_c0_g1_i1:49-1356(+)